MFIYTHTWLLIFSCTAAMCLFNLPFLETWFLIFSFSLLYEAAYPHSLQTWFLMFSCTASMWCFKASFLEAAYPHSLQTWFLIFSCTASMCRFKYIYIYISEYKACLCYLYGSQCWSSFSALWPPKYMRSLRIPMEGRKRVLSYWQEGNSNDCDHNSKLRQIKKRQNIHMASTTRST